MCPGPSGRTAEESDTPTRTARWRLPGSSQRLQSIEGQEERADQLLREIVDQTPNAE